ncbi:hypothetical protein ABT187_35805 [Streptomyces sp. NPDC001817]|uniref:hypothetical protein n=1 Tax=Streptomyces sp. NPDC001817 TaxID=3154398 RepID=UPI00333398BE
MSMVTSTRLPSRVRPCAGVVPCVAVVAVVGCYVPLLGVPLTGFLAVDVVLSWVARRRTGHAHA